MRNLTLLVLAGFLVGCGEKGGGGGDPSFLCEERLGEVQAACAADCHLDHVLIDDTECPCTGCTGRAVCSDVTNMCEEPPPLPGCVGDAQAQCEADGLCGEQGSCTCTCAEGLTCSSDGVTGGTCEEPEPPADQDVASIGVTASGTSTFLQAAAWTFTPGTAVETIVTPTATSKVIHVVFGANPLGTTTYHAPGDATATDGTTTFTASPGGDMRIFEIESGALGDVGDPITLTLAAGAVTPAMTFTVPRAGDVQLGQSLAGATIPRDAVLHLTFTPTSSGVFRATFVQSSGGGNTVGSVWADASTGVLDVPVAFLDELGDGSVAINYDVTNEVAETFGTYAATGYTRGQVMATGGGLAFTDTATLVATSPP